MCRLHLTTHSPPLPVRPPPVPQTGQMVSALLGWPQATFASSLVLDPAAAPPRTATVTREVDGGLETVSEGGRDGGGCSGSSGSPF